MAPLRVTNSPCATTTRPVAGSSTAATNRVGQASWPVLHPLLPWVDGRLDDLQPALGGLALHFFLLEGVEHLHASTMRPKAEYLPSRCGAAPSIRKNDVVAESGSSERAMETMPRTCLTSSRNSPFSVRTQRSAGWRRRCARVPHAALHHETLHHAMKAGAVEPAGGGELQKIAHVIRRPVGLHLDLDRAERGLQRDGPAQFVRRGVERTAPPSSSRW